MKISTFPITKFFDLSSDPDGEANITVRQAREGENSEREELFSTTTRVFESQEIGSMGFDPAIKLERKQNPAKIRRKEAYLTLGKVVGITDQDGNELFRTADGIDGPSVRMGMNETEFNRAWNMLPPEVAKEICACVWETNPHWNPERLGE